MVIVAGFAMVAGAVYSPADVIKPVAELPPATPSTAHVTALSVLPVTAAVYCDGIPSVTFNAPATTTVTVLESPFPPNRLGSLIVRPHAVSHSRRMLHIAARLTLRKATSIPVLFLKPQLGGVIWL
jgi:hypothetical protein